VAEWGDSYRILRASEFLREFEYPDDEKRPPLYSMILAVRPTGIDQIFYGRAVMFVVSILCFLMVSKLIDQLGLDQVTKNISLLFFSLNPVFLYWSIRIMADAFFTLIVLLSLSYFLKWKENRNSINIFITGIITGLAVLTRFEGYLLLGALLVGLAVKENLKPKDLTNVHQYFDTLRVNLKDMLFLLAGFTPVVVTYFIYNNPFGSKYFEEPSGRAYDLKMVSIYLVSLVFIYGFLYGCFFIYKGKNRIVKIMLKHPSISTFVILELLLILLWPAAIPRLFTPLIPFFAILIGIGVEEYFSEQRPDYKGIAFLILLLTIYPISQYILKLQFNVLVKNTFLVILAINLFMLYPIIKRKLNLFLLLSLVSMLIWSLSTIRLHKDIFISVKNAGEYVHENLSGLVLYNDVSSVSDWYLNQKTKNDGVWGYYYNTESKENLTFDVLSSLEPDYLLITNEHNTTMELDLEKRPYLIVIKEFSYNVNDGDFYAKIVKFDKGFK
jgi:hypothetical protein